MSKNVENVDRAARVLAGFGMDGADLIAIYFRTDEDRVVGTRLTPSDTNWQEDEWHQFITERMENHSVLNPQEIVALKVEFHLASGSKCGLELTDLDRRMSFNRVVFMDYPFADIYLTIVESHSIQSINDAIEFCDQITTRERQRRHIIGTNLPEVML